MAELATSKIVLRAAEGEVGWTLVELQGTIESRAGTSLDGVEFGKLVREVHCQIKLNHCVSLRLPSSLVDNACLLSGVSMSQGGKPRLVMGKMQLEGQEVKLKKPLAIMSLVAREDGTSEYHTAGVVRSKAVFKTRPVPVSRPPLPKTPPGPGSVGSKRTRAQEPSDSTVPP
jgi:hypothetical protein